jgi:hypothetical protein
LVRKLYPWEIEEFRAVFGDTLHYERITIHECNPWPDWIDRLGRRLKGQEPLGLGGHNAITLGNRCFFPVNLPQSLLPVDHPESYKHEWLVHELTHAWQFQRMGWAYLVKALIAQFRDKDWAYDFGGEEGLLKSRQKNKLFKDFNPEQQGNITESYYERVRRGKDVSAWEPYISEVKGQLFQ